MNACPYRDALSWLEAEAEIDAWEYALHMYWSSHGPERRWWADEVRRMFKRERKRLAAGRVALHATYLARGIKR